MVNGLSVLPSADEGEVISSMNIPDIINSGFESSAGLIGLLNVRAIRRARAISGVHWLPTCVFSLWGLFNLYYYPHLDQWFSFAGGTCIAAVNITWLAHVAYYSKIACLPISLDQPANPDTLPT